MLARILTVFRIPDLRQKIILTLILLAVYRLGFFIPLSFIDRKISLKDCVGWPSLKGRWVR